MFIQPDTTVRILKNCPLDTSHENTLYFSTKEEQTVYFASLTKTELTKQSYHRYGNSALKVNLRADDLYDCNYIMFQNASFSNKWFYAFLTSIEYISNDVAQITYQLDPMQTWLFDTKLIDCFVEREHSATDVPGDNLIAENLEIGEYVLSNPTSSGLFDNWGYMVAVSTYVDEVTGEMLGDAATPSYGAKYGGFYQGLTFLYRRNAELMQALVFKLASEIGPDTIQGIIAVPTFFAEPSETTTRPAGVIKDEQIRESITASKVNTVGDYVPRNKKLLTYPYNFLYVSNLQGQGAAYPYEYFSTENCQFEVACDASLSPNFMLSPLYYKGSGEGISGLGNIDERLLLSGVPQISYATDTFKAWLAQNGSTIATNIAVQSLNAGIAAGIMTMDPMAAFTSGGMSALSGATSTLSQLQSVQHTPAQAHTPSGLYTPVAQGYFDFMLANKHIQIEFAKIIDDYFDKFGYATHRVKKPNITARPHWNFIKTQGITCQGSVPADDLKQINTIYNTGVTFWKNGSEVGNYSLDNSL